METKALSSAELLTAWERGLPHSLPRRALILLAAACPSVTVEALTGLPIGERDARLLALREATFGLELTSVASCPRCAEPLELAFTTADIRVPPPSETPPTTLTLCHSGCSVRFRLPNSGDLLALESLPAEKRSPQTLLARCLIAIEWEDGETAESLRGQADDRTLPAEVAASVMAQMAEADPQSEIELACVCPACGEAWLATFDILSFFWTEIEVWAKRLLREVHTLASAYGWREADILAMSAYRRQLYLEMVMDL